MSKAINSDKLHTATTKDLGQSNGGLCGGFNVRTSEMGFLHADCFPGLCKCLQRAEQHRRDTVIVEASG